MRITYRLLFFIGGVLSCSNLVAQQAVLKGRVTDSLGQALVGVNLLLQQNAALVQTDAKGDFSFGQLPLGDYSLFVEMPGFSSQTLPISFAKKEVKQLLIVMKSLELEGPEVEVSLNNANYGLNRFRSVDWESMVIGAAKKSEIIDCNKLEANLASNNSRQIYAKVAGLNIWENDNSGIQLNIGGRGLSPNRTSNFNTRQNGYDISADALGYPESYYTPPAQALQRIELIRGAASLQYGTQFGGLLNFVMRQGNPDSPLELLSENTYGSFNFFNSFNSIGGTLAKGKLSYYGFFQYKSGDGWRPASDYKTQNGYFSVRYQATNKLSFTLEQTLMHYLAHQPGGLTDLEFSRNPRQSNRVRNWFMVDWRVSSLSMDYRIGPNTKLNMRNFALIADRSSVGNLSPINRADYGGARDLIKGAYHNFGSETRLLHRYSIGKNIGVALAGVRLYRGFTQQAQGFSNADSTGNKNDFSFVEAGDLRSDYNFPSFNGAAFFENYFNLGKGFSVTPGLRYEFIRTDARGTYQDLYVVPGTNGPDTLRNEQIAESRTRSRSIVLAGLGFSYQPEENCEFYANFSQNYRAINFNDMRIVNPNQEIDPNLKDEYGFNADMGFRGRVKTFLNFDVSLFYLSYQQRIGNIQVERSNPENPALIELVTQRSNIGNARVFGLESLVELDLWQWLKGEECAWGIVVFSNFSLLDGRYTKTEQSYTAGKRLELVPPLTLKTGVTAYIKDFRANFQYSYTAKHYSDATNAESAANAVVGIIPAYSVLDASMSYNWKWFKLQMGVNNLLNATYFTRRAASYPGPGILPADGRSFYVSLQSKLVLPKKKAK